MAAKGVGVAVLFATLGWTAACGSAQPADGGDDTPDAADDGGTTDDVVADGDDGAACEAGLRLCGGECVDVLTSVDHCGDCDHPCEGGPHGTAACAAGSCGMDCEVGWYDIDGSPGCEYACTPAEPAVDACNGVDDDCDGETDETFECPRGSTEPCTTSCGTAGTRICSDTCAWDCVPPEEICDGLDQNCNGIADDGVYEVLWNVVAAARPTGGYLSYSAVGVAAGEIGVGYLAHPTTAETTARPYLLRAGLDDGMTSGLPDALAALSDVPRLRGAASGDVITFVWDTGTDSGTPPENTVLRSVTMGSAFALGVAGNIDASATDVSTWASVARAATEDLAVVVWDEFRGTSYEFHMATVRGVSSPFVENRLLVSTLSNYDWPDVAVMGDSMIAAVWPDGLPEIHMQRFDLTLTPLAGISRLEATPTAARVPRIAASSDSFMVAWEEVGVGVKLAAFAASDGTITVPARRFGPSGAVNTAIAADLVDGFAVAYMTTTDAELVRVSADGSVSTSFVFPGGSFPSVASIPGGGLIVSYVAGLFSTLRLARIGCTP